MSGVVEFQLEMVASFCFIDGFVLFLWQQLQNGEGSKLLRICAQFEQNCLFQILKYSSGTEPLNLPIQCSCMCLCNEEAVVHDLAFEIGQSSIGQEKGPFVGISVLFLDF